MRDSKKGNLIRTLKPGDGIRSGSVDIIISEVRGNKVKVMIQAPRDEKFTFEWIKVEVENVGLHNKVGSPTKRR